MAPMNKRGHSNSESAGHHSEVLGCQTLPHHLRFLELVVCTVACNTPRHGSGVTRLRTSNIRLSPGSTPEVIDVGENCFAMHAGRALLACARDPYRVLGLSQSATRRQVRKRYLELAKLLHPDSVSSGVSSDAFVELNAAYEELAALPERVRTRANRRPSNAWRHDEPWRRDWAEDGGEEDGELLMRLRRDSAGGRGRVTRASPSSACVRSWKNGEPPCFIICAACKTVEKTG